MILKLQWNADFHAPIKPMCKQVTTSFSQAGRFPVARRHHHYHQRAGTNSVMLMDAEMVPRLIRSWNYRARVQETNFLLVWSAPGLPWLQGKWHESCISWASSLECCAQRSPWRRECMQHACCLIPLVPRLELWYPRKKGQGNCKVRQLQNTLQTDTHWRGKCRQASEL